MAKIGIDMDEVLSLTLPAFIEYHNQKYKTNKTIDDCYKLKSKDYIEAHAELFDISKAEFIKRWYEFCDTDYHHSMKPMDESIESILNLSKNHDLYIITSRSPNALNVTRNWLNKHYGNAFKEIKQLEYHDHNHNLAKFTKADLCKMINIDIFIDDTLEHAINCANAGIPVLLFDNQEKHFWNNTKEKLNPLIKRVHSWKEIEKEINLMFH